MHEHDLEVEYDDNVSNAMTDGYYRAIALNHASGILHPVVAGLDAPAAIAALIEGAEQLRGWLSGSGSEYMLPLSKESARDLVVLLDTAISSGQHTGRSAQTARRLIQILAEHAV